ncbi:MAG TPA: hypothetical protein VIH61_01135 [Waddliaceae bacterium]
MTATAIGVVALVGGFFLLLAALQVLPQGVNTISQFGIGGKLAGGVSIGLGIMAMGHGMIHPRNRSRESSISDPFVHSEVASRASRDNVQRFGDAQQTIQMISTPSEGIHLPAGKDTGSITCFVKPLKFCLSNLLPTSSLPLETIHIVCSFLKPSAASLLACVSKDWNFYVNEGYEERVNALFSQGYQLNYPYSDAPKKKYSTLTCLGMILEDALYQKYMLNELYSPYLVEITATIKHWGTVRAIMVDQTGCDWCFVVDFHHPISLSYSTGIIMGAANCPCVLRGMYQTENVMILSNKRMAFSIKIIRNCFLKNYTDVIDDPRIKALNRRIHAHKLQNNYPEALRLEREYLLFSGEDLLSFTLQMVKNIGKKILAQGVYLIGNARYQGFTIKKIVENYRSHHWQLTYLPDSLDAFLEVTSL